MDTPNPECTKGTTLFSGVELVQNKKSTGEALSITFGDQAENHVGMQMIGTRIPAGLTIEELRESAQKWETCGYKCELIELHPHLPTINRETAEAEGVSMKAAILIVRNGAAAFKSRPDELLAEQKQLKVDKKAKMRGRVVNKLARWNLCYGDEEQEPDYDAGKGRVVAFTSVPKLNTIREKLPYFFGPKAANLVAELNMYYDITKCGIGFHGDTERRIVVCIRLGDQIPLHFQWFLQSKSIGERIKLTLNHGDIYAMSEKAVGSDWKKRKIPTLRHAAGAEKYLRTRK